MNVANQSSNYDWSNHNMNSGVQQGTQPLSIDTSLSNARSMPTTPATTPPGGNVQGISSYQNQSGYDSSKQYYSSAPQSQPQYTQQQPMGQPGMGSYTQSMTPNSYIKNDMAPPSGRPTAGQGEPDQSDVKSDRYAQANGQVPHGAGESDAVQEHETDYIHDNNAAAYHTNRNSYTYSTGDHAQLSSGLAAPQPHQNGSDQMTPRTATGAPAQWAQGYGNPPSRAQPASLYNIVSDPRSATTNGATDSFGSAPASNYSAPLNGSGGSAKRLRDDDDDRSGRPDSRGPADYDGKRRKTLTDSGIGGPMGASMMNLQQAVQTGGMRGRR
jgi:protein SOK2